MNRVGPALESLTARLAGLPADFLGEPRIAGKGAVHVDAVAGDLLALFGDPVPANDLARFGARVSGGERNRLALALLTSWLLADDWFQRAGLAPVDVLRALDAASTELAPHATAKSFHADPERREELARTVLARLGYRPAGESPAQAQDRLVSVSASERRRAVDGARGAAERARAIREALARKAAQESADKMWRE
jgi:hypothetical protein